MVVVTICNDHYYPYVKFLLKNRLSTINNNNIPARAANINSINDIGKQDWQKSSNYNFRSLVETTISRYKKIIGTMVHSKKLNN